MRNKYRYFGRQNLNPVLNALGREGEKIQVPYWRYLILKLTGYATVKERITSIAQGN